MLKRAWWIMWFVSMAIFLWAALSVLWKLDGYKKTIEKEAKLYNAPSGCHYRIIANYHEFIVDHYEINSDGWISFSNPHQSELPIRVTGNIIIAQECN